MSGEFEKKGNEKEKENNQAAIGSGAAANLVVRKQTGELGKKFEKPPYNPETRKSLYDNAAARKRAKDMAFSQGNPVDPYTGKELVPTVKDAKAKYGANWQEHLAEADHEIPLNRVADKGQKMPFVSVGDTNKIANSPDNFQIISREINQNGNKGGSTPAEWSNDPKRMQKLSEQSGERPEALAEKIRKSGEAAEKEINRKLSQVNTTNALKSANAAGVDAAVNSGGTAAAISALNNIVACIQGKESVSEAIKNIGEDGCKATVRGYFSGAAITVLNHTLASCESEFLSALGRNNVPGYVIAAVSMTGGTVCKWAKGEISTGECLNEIGKTSFVFAGSLLGGIAGEAIIPIPVLGNAVGSFVGGALAGGLYDVVTTGIPQAIEAVSFYAEENRRKRVQDMIEANTARAVVNSVLMILQGGEIEGLLNEAALYVKNKGEIERRIAECVLLTEQMREYRMQLQSFADEYLAACEAEFSSAFELMDSCLNYGDYNGAIEGANRITELFGEQPIANDTEGFREKLFGNDKISL